ncbi:hypothetical protein PIB30_114461, partial [Stylosanthes scabra]|nr:hypothetical protein [Stylosanthes scabra]
LSIVIYLKESNRILFDPHFSMGTISTPRVILLDPVHLPESLLCLRKRKRKVFERSHMHMTARICVEGKLPPNILNPRTHQSYPTHMRRSKAYAWKKNSSPA